MVLKVHFFQGLIQEAFPIAGHFLHSDTGVREAFLDALFHDRVT